MIPMRTFSLSHLICSVCIFSSNNTGCHPPQIWPYITKLNKATVSGKVSVWLSLVISSFDLFIIICNMTPKTWSYYTRNNCKGSFTRREFLVWRTTSKTWQVWRKKLAKWETIPRLRFWRKRLDGIFLNSHATPRMYFFVLDDASIYW